MTTDVVFDHGRGERIGLDEAVFCVGKSIAQIAAILEGAKSRGSGLLLTRLTAEKCDRLVTIPTEAKLASLNVSNAAAIAAYEWKRRRTS